MADNPLPRDLLDRLHAEGLAHDRAEPDRLRRRRNLEPAAAELLWILLHAAGSRRVLEIGTSNGYSTLWFAAAMRELGGRVTSVDIDPHGQREAGIHLAEAGLAEVVDLLLDEGGRYLSALASESVDALFLDAERTEYAAWWPHPLRVLRPGGVLVVDNALSHPDEVADITALVDAAPDLRAVTVGVGKGELISVKNR